MRDIDRIIQFIEGYEAIPPVHKRVLINRIEPTPTRDEIERARAQVYPDLSSQLTPGTRPCGAEREPDGEVCAGTLTFAPGDVQAKCSVCGGWMGRLAPGHEQAVTPTGSNVGVASE